MIFYMRPKYWPLLPAKCLHWVSDKVTIETGPQWIDL